MKWIGKLQHIVKFIVAFKYPCIVKSILIYTNIIPTKFKKFVQLK